MIRHAMNLLGACERQVARFWLLRSRAVTLIRWDGCMAEIRTVAAIGRLVRRESRYSINGALSILREIPVQRRARAKEYPGIIVRFSDGDRWYPLESVRFIGGAFGSIEVWQ